MWGHPVSSPSGRLAPQFCDIFTHWALAAHGPVLRALSICMCMCLVIHSCPSLCNPMDYMVQGILQTRNTGVDSLSLLQGIFPAQGSIPGLPHCRQILYQLPSVCPPLKYRAATWCWPGSGWFKEWRPPGCRGVWVSPPQGPSSQPCFPPSHGPHRC